MCVFCFPNGSYISFGWSTLAEGSMYVCVLYLVKLCPLETYRERGTVQQDVI